MKVILLFIAIIAISSASIVQRSNGAPWGWTNTEDIEKTEIFKFTFVLKQCNLHLLEDTLKSVSNPQSIDYGKYLSVEEVNDLVRCDGHEANVLSYLSQFNTRKVEINGPSIKVITTVEVAENILNTEFHEFVHQKSNARLIRHIGEIDLPESVANAIHFILGVDDYFHDTKYSAASYMVKKQTIQPAKYNPNTYKFSDPYVTPVLLRRLYDIPADESCTNPKNFFGIAAFDNDYDEYALCRFQGLFNGYSDPPVVNFTGPPVGSDQIESDLDVQYSTAIANGVVSEFANHGPGEWVLDWALETVQSSQNGPWVWSLSYGWPEVYQCAPAGSGLNITKCPTGYDYQDYIDATNTEISKMGSLGVTVSVSSGDDGTPGFASNCPMDPDYPLNINGLGSFTCAGAMESDDCQCAGLQITLTSGGSTQVCNLPLGLLYPSACSEMLGGPYGEEIEIAVGEYLYSPQQGYCNISSAFSQSALYFYSNCTCDELTVSTTDVPGAVIEIGGQVYNPENGNAFLPDYPTASPYVTSVGAVAIQFSYDVCSSKDLVDLPEIYCQASQAAAFSGGGGFSSVTPVPEWQQQFIENYLSVAPQLPPSSTYNASNRGYPDVSMNGHNYMVSVGLSAQEENVPVSGLNGAVIPISGTSASSPAFAGMIALLNDHLLNSNAPTLGFLNPLLYQMASSDPSTFNDIVPQTIQTPQGSIDGGSFSGCTQMYCCEYGFSVTKGYDVATGLGTPNYSNILSHIQQLWKARGITVV